MIEEGVYQFIQQNSALQAVMASSDSLFMMFVPESAQYPCLMFEVVSLVNDTTMDGPSGYAIRRYQFSCLARDLPNVPGSGAVQAKKLADTLRQQIDGLTGTLPDGTLLYNVILDQELDSYDDQTGTYHSIQDYFFHFRRDP